MNNIMIREAGLSDASALIEYLKCVTGETNFLRMYPDEVKFSVEDEENYIQQMLEQENSSLILALDGKKIVSVAGITGQQLRKFRHRAEFGVSVLQEYWGRGIGTEMTRRMVLWCRENPIIKKLVLHVNAENKSAVKIYEKLGFKKEGTLRNDFFYEGKFFDTYIYGMKV
jgi:RimJ/RimL family protein N-acetyltransferase